MSNHRDAVKHTLAMAHRKRPGGGSMRGHVALAPAAGKLASKMPHVLAEPHEMIARCLSG